MYIYAIICMRMCVCIMYLIYTHIYIYILNTGSRPQCVPTHRFSSWAETSLGTIGIETTYIYIYLCIYIYI